MNASSPPASSAGATSGRVIWRKARAGVAYRSAAASSSDSSSPAMRARTIRVTTAELKIDWPNHSGNRPRRKIAAEIDEPDLEADGVDDLRRDEDQEDERQERLRPDARSAGERDAGQPAEHHGDQRGDDRDLDRVRRPRASGWSLSSNRGTSGS